MLQTKCLLIGASLILSFSSIQSQELRLKHEIPLSGNFIQIPFIKERGFSPPNLGGSINNVDNLNCNDFENDGISEFFIITSPTSGFLKTKIDIYDGATCNLKYTVTIDSANLSTINGFQLSFMDIDGDNTKELVGEFAYYPSNPISSSYGPTRLLFIDVRSNKIKYSLNRYQGTIVPNGYIAYAFYDIDNDGYPEVICKWQSDTSNTLRIYGGSSTGMTAPSQFLAKQKTPLLKNMQNPFLGSAKLEYYVTDLNDVFLNIFDSEGRIIRTLVNKKQPMGEYSVIWDGKDDNGQSISSGQFYYQLKVGSFISTKKVIAVK
jgi:hypothetical protein